MIKLLISVITSFVVFCSVSFGAKSYMENEQKYFFRTENLVNTFVKFIEDDKKKEACVDLYVQLMNQETGHVGIGDLFSVCREAGFNTYRELGYTQCREMIVYLANLEQSDIDENMISGFCPGLDEKGKNPNSLWSITDETRIGDFCKSTNIAGGEVVFKKGYNCTCMAYACNFGYEFKGGACKTRVADGNGNCLRQEYPRTTQNDTIEKLVDFCGQKAAANKCKYNAVLLSKDSNKVICNPTATEQDVKKAEYEEAEQARRANIDALPYKEVCDKDKGKTGGEEHCIKGFFNWIKVGMIQATALAKEYALVKDNRVIYCSDKYRTSWNDDYVKCVTEDKKHFYEFQFDSVNTSIDATIDNGVRSGICKIHNLDGWTAPMTNDSGCASTCSAALIKTATKFGLTTQDRAGACVLQSRRLGKNEQDKLAKIDGIDNNIFYHGIQVQGSQQIIRKLRDYIAGLGKYTIKTFNCDNSVGKIQKGISETDDILRCYLNGDPVDFVFDDISEAWETYHKGGMQGIDCIVSGGTYSGAGCLGLDKTKCDAVAKINANTCPECRKAYYDNNLQQCVLPASASATSLEKGVKLGTIVAGATASVIITVATGGAGALMIVELAGSGIEFAATAKMQQEAQKFLNASNVCKDSSCAERMIKDNLQRLANLQSEFTGAELNAIDSEMARLFKLVPVDSFKSSKLSDNQLSMFDLRSWEPEQIWRAVGFVAQMASTIYSVGQWITGKVRGLTKTTAAIADKLDEAADTSRALVKLDNADNVAGMLDNVDDAANLAAQAAKTAGDVGDVIYDAAYFSKNPSGIDDIIKEAKDVIQIDRKNMSGTAIRDLMLKAKAAGLECVDCSSDILKFSKKMDDIADAGMAAMNNVDNLANNADNIANNVEKQARFDKIRKAQEDAIERARVAINDGTANTNQFNRYMAVAQNDKGEALKRGKKLLDDGTQVDSFRNQAEEIIRNEVLQRAQLNINSSGDVSKFSSEVQKINREFLEAADKATTEQEFIQLIQNRHVDIESVIGDKMNVNVSAVEFAQGLRDKYLNGAVDMVKDNPNLLNELDNWGELTEKRQAEILSSLNKKVFPDVEQSKIIINNAGEGGASNLERVIELSNVNNVELDTLGHRGFANMRQNLDHAMILDSHEMTHSVLIHDPAAGIIPENMVADTVIHSPTANGIGVVNTNDLTGPKYLNTGYGDYRWLNPNEVTAHTVGTTVGEGFLDALHKLLGK